MEHNGPSQHPKDLANSLADHFVSVTNQSTELCDNDVPESLAGPGLIPQLDQKTVEKVLRSYKKCNSRVVGDIPRDLVNPCSKKLAEALTLIYNSSFLNKEWPNAWKIETIILIPKTISPALSLIHI